MPEVTGPDFVLPLRAVGVDAPPCSHMTERVFHRHTADVNFAAFDEGLILVHRVGGSVLVWPVQGL